MSEFVEFQMRNPEQFELLQKAFDKLKQDKNSDSMGNDERYLPLFDEQARAYFWWPTPEEVKEHSRKWFATPLETRWTDPSLQHGWTFGSMIEAFTNGEYELGSCEMTEPGIGRMTFNTFSYPYGGISSFVVLAESFGHKVLVIYDGASEPQTLALRE